MSPEQFTAIVENAAAMSNEDRPASTTVVPNFIGRNDAGAQVCIGVTVKNKQYSEFFACLVDAICDELGDAEGLTVARQILLDRDVDVRGGKSTVFFPGYTYTPINEAVPT